MTITTKPHRITITSTGNFHCCYGIAVSLQQPIHWTFQLVHESGMGTRQTEAEALHTLFNAQPRVSHLKLVTDTC